MQAPPDPRPEPTHEQARVVGSPEHVALWDAINTFRDAANGIARMNAVVLVERSLAALLAEVQRETLEEAARECEGDDSALTGKWAMRECARRIRALKEKAK